MHYWVILTVFVIHIFLIWENLLMDRMTSYFECFGSKDLPMQFSGRTQCLRKSSSTQRNVVAILVTKPEFLFAKGKMLVALATILVAISGPEAMYSVELHEHVQHSTLWTLRHKHIAEQKRKIISCQCWFSWLRRQHRSLTVQAGSFTVPRKFFDSGNSAPLMSVIIIKESWKATMPQTFYLLITNTRLQNIHLQCTCNNNFCASVLPFVQSGIFLCFISIDNYYMLPNTGKY